MKEYQYNGYTVHYQLIPAVNSFGRSYKYCKIIAAFDPSGKDVTLEVNGESGNIGPMIEKNWLNGIRYGIRTVSKPGYVWISAADMEPSF